jgi:acyl-CoA thioesterase-1
MSERSVDGQPKFGRAVRATLVLAALPLFAVAPLTACGHPSRAAAASDSVRAAAPDSGGDQRSLASVPDDRNGGALVPPSPAAGRDGPLAPVILFIGTSLTAGYGLEATDAFPEVVGALLDSAGHPARIINAGVSGETSAGARTRIDWVLRQPADVIVLETGANDGLRGLSVAAARENIQVILDHIRAKRPTARVLLVQMEAPPNLGGSYTADFRAMYPELAKTNGIELVPFLLEGVAGNPSLNQDDGIHPNRAGARIVARNVYRALIKRPLVTTPTH